MAATVRPLPAGGSARHASAGRFSIMYWFMRSLVSKEVSKAWGSENGAGAALGIGDLLKMCHRIQHLQVGCTIACAGTSRRETTLQAGSSNAIHAVRNFPPHHFLPHCHAGFFGNAAGGH